MYQPTSGDEKLSVMASSAYDANFHKMVLTSAAIVRRLGAIPTPDHRDKEAAAVGFWISRQVSLVAFGVLPALHRASLEAWIPGFDDLVSRHYAHGERKRQTNNFDQVLARISTPQRKRDPIKRAHHVAGLSETRERLEATHLTKWKKKLGLVTAFYEEHGRMPAYVPSEPEEMMLSNWVSIQRTKRRKGRLSSECQDMLNESLPDWLFVPDGPIAFEDRCREVGEFFFDHWRHPFNCSDNWEENVLGRWLLNQKRFYRNQSLRPANVELLGHYAGAWNSLKKSRTPELKQVAAFKRRHHAFPQSTSADPSEAYLGRWLDHQITRSRERTLFKDQRTALEDTLGRNWDARELAT